MARATKVYDELACLCFDQDYLYVSFPKYGYWIHFLDMAVHFTMQVIVSCCHVVSPALFCRHTVRDSEGDFILAKKFTGIKSPSESVIHGHPSFASVSVELIT